jgi:hypothetical protein
VQPTTTATTEQQQKQQQNNKNKTIRATQPNISRYALQQCHKLAANCHPDSCLIALLPDLHSMNLTLIHSNGLTVQLTNSCIGSN